LCAFVEDVDFVSRRRVYGMAQKLKSYSAPLKSESEAGKSPRLDFENIKRAIEGGRGYENQ
jgi:hypothetical protein